MIKIYGKKYTPKRAAQLIIEDALSSGVGMWELDTDPGQELDRVMTERERELIDDQLGKILRRFDKYL